MKRSAAPWRLDPAWKVLQELPNIGPRMADDLMRLGMTDTRLIARSDPDDLYERLCLLDGEAHDPCVRDTLHAVVDFARGGPPVPWWEYSRRRKAQEAKKGGGKKTAKRKTGYSMRSS